MLADATNEFIDSIAPKEVKAQENKKHTATVVELTFGILKYESQKGSQLGDFEVAHKQNNLPDKWNSPFNIMRVNNATIADRYYGENYEFSYWLFGADKIYRQKRKKNGEKQCKATASI